MSANNEMDFCRQIKNYNGIKHSMRDLIRDVNYCA